MAFLTTTTAPSFFDRIRSILQTLKTRRTQNRLFRETLHELSSLSNRELADLGISRTEIRHIARETSENLT
jgi:uncharacterized protein YjiS (DUF1127 family)